MPHSDKTRLLFFCGERSRWGIAHLLSLLSNTQVEVVAVVLATDKRWTIFRQAIGGQEPHIGFSLVDSLKKIIKSLLKKSPPSRTAQAESLLRSKNIPIIYCDDVNLNYHLEQFQKLNPDVIFSAAYPQIFKPKLLTFCNGNVFNSHPSLLPRCRGAHPVFWTIASGESESGGTIHYMTPKLDQGDIVAQVKVDLLPTDNYSELYTKLESCIPELISQFNNYLRSNRSTIVKQDNSKATYFRNDRLIHRRIFWSQMTALQAHNLVRACNGNAYFWHQGKKILILHAEITHTNRNVTNDILVPAGTVVDIIGNIPTVALKTEYLTIKKFKVQGWSKIQFEIGEVFA